jgi:hypothetical protein
VRELQPFSSIAEIDLLCSAPMMKPHALANYIPFGNSTSSMANIIVVNGPIRDEIGMNYGANVMGPHNEANSAIGRLYTLMSKTIGGLHSEKTT